MNFLCAARKGFVYILPLVLPVFLLQLIKLN